MYGEEMTLVEKWSFATFETIRLGQITKEYCGERTGCDGCPARAACDAWISMNRIRRHLYHKILNAEMEGEIEE